MDSILQTITTGQSHAMGLRFVIGAQEKLGKTTLCSQAPGSLLVPCEVGFAGITTPKTGMVQNWDQVQQFMAETIHWAQQGKFPYKTIAFDSATAIERHIHDYVIRKDPAHKAGGKKQLTMETAHGGYGKAYHQANDEFDWFLQQCDLLAVNAGINIIMTCHAFASKVIDPTSGEYDSWDLLLHSPKNQKTYGKRERITQWADVIGFLYDPIFVTKGDGGKMSTAVSQNKGRVLGLSRTPSYTAGNRFGIIGEVAIPAPPEIGWNALAKAIYDTTKGAVDVYTR